MQFIESSNEYKLFDVGHDEAKHNIIDNTASVRTCESFKKEHFSHIMKVNVSNKDKMEAKASQYNRAHPYAAAENDQKLDKTTDLQKPSYSKIAYPSKFKIKLTAEEWDLCCPADGLNHKKNLKLQRPYTNIVAKKVYDVDPRCALWFNYQHVKAHDSRKAKQPYVTATAESSWGWKQQNCFWLHSIYIRSTVGCAFIYRKTATCTAWVVP